MDAGFSERFIHSKIYKAYPDVHATIHSHSLAIILFSISSQPIAACFRMASFLGCRVPSGMRIPPKQMKIIGLLYQTWGIAWGNAL